ncbi:MAG: type IV pilus modification PilV family protein [Planctomycetota bacterium]|jgi:prepilin-type N-terminal cleavage/methylation domain-containing protein
MTRLNPKAFTLIEVLASVAILSGVIATVVLWSANGLAASMELEHTSKSTRLAEVEMEKIKSALREDFQGEDFTAWSSDLGNNYLAGRSETDVSSSLKIAEVSVGYDADNSGTLAAAEIMVTLTTQVAEVE